MGQIVLLDDLTINKIAAGEVVDRPSSIVKELVENSIDAGAKNITIEIKNGGITYIKIVDDGAGFKSDDVLLAFERHATSKIRSEADILKVTSMGFRGEALASIAAISKVELVTKNENEDIGTRTIVEAGNVIDSSESPARKGTTIIVKNIFFNVPARYKFLKKDFTEAGYIEDSIRKLALINTDISFKYINNNKTIISTTGNSDAKTCIYSIFGKEVSSNILFVDNETDGIKVTGVIGTQNISRSNRSHEYFYVNSRYVKNKTLSSAIDEGFKQNIAIGKFPFCILNIEVPTDTIDINVHPAKLEVKFENEQLIFRAIHNAVKSTLLKHNTENSPFTLTKNEIETENEIVSNEKKVTAVISEIKKVEYEPVIYESSCIFTDTKDIKEIDNVESFNENNLKKMYENTIEAEYIPPVEKKAILYKYRGTIFNTYPIVEIGEKIYIIDQHAAHERLLYEQVKEVYYSKDKQSQMLLLPIIIELTGSEMTIYNENSKVFTNAGFLTDNFGDNALKIVGVPNINYEIDFSNMFMDLIDELNGTYKTEKIEKENRFLATVACKAAVKANMKLTDQECVHLIDEMMKLDRPFTCPHGRPTAYEISKYEIERRFLRK